jgi:hypothetical protein
MIALQNQNQIFIPAEANISSGPAPGTNDRVTEAAEQRTTEAGENRIIE